MNRDSDKNAPQEQPRNPKGDTMFFSVPKRRLPALMQVLKNQHSFHSDDDSLLVWERTILNTEFTIGINIFEATCHAELAVVVGAKTGQMTSWLRLEEMEPTLRRKVRTVIDTILRESENT